MDFIIEAILLLSARDVCLAVVKVEAAQSRLQSAFIGGGICEAHKDPLLYIASTCKAGIGV